MARLTCKRQAFVDAYIKNGGNATHAAITAKYSPRSAKCQGSRLLSISNVREAIDRRRARIATRADITAEKVLVELARIGFSNLEDFVDLQDGGRLRLADVTRDQASALNSITTTVDRVGEEIVKTKTIVKLHDKRAALHDLGSHLRLFGDASAVHVTVEHGERLSRARARVQAALDG